MPFAPLVLAAALAASPLAGVPPVGVPMVEPVTCEITDATLTWGFKESFRAYLDSDIANGSWTTAGNASYATPSFTWSGGIGSYTPLYDRVEVDFTGAVEFTGHEGLLDTTIADPSIDLYGPTGLLSLDVSGPTMDGDQVDVANVGFVDLASSGTQANGSTRTVDSEAALTPDGSTAFPNYEPGTGFDPVSVTFQVGDDCPTAQPVDDVETSDVVSPLQIGLIVVGVLAAAAVLVAIVVARRRRA